MKKILLISGVVFLLILVFGYFITPKEEIEAAYNEGVEQAKETQIEEVVEVPKNCYYTKVSINSQIGDGEMTTKVVEGCWGREIIEGTGMTEIVDENKIVKVLFYEDEKPNLKRLNIRFNDTEPIEWRSAKGHDIMYLLKDKKESFIFGDRSNGIKGSITFE